MSDLHFSLGDLRFAFFSRRFAICALRVWFAICTLVSPHLFALWIIVHFQFLQKFSLKNGSSRIWNLGKKNPLFVWKIEEKTLTSKIGSSRLEKKVFFFSPYFGESVSSNEISSSAVERTMRQEWQNQNFTFQSLLRAQAFLDFWINNPGWK